MENDILSTPVKDVMTQKVTIIDKNAALEKVREIFNHSQFHHLLVLEDHKLIGVISDRDLLREISPFLETMAEQKRDHDRLNKRIHVFMTKKPITITQEATIKFAALLLLEKGISCLPVTSPEGYVRGIITMKDILHYICVGSKMK